MDIQNFSILKSESDKRAGTAATLYLSDIILKRSRQRLANRHIVRTKLDETREVMRKIINSFNEKTDEGFADALSMMADLKGNMVEFTKSFNSYSSSRQRTLAKDDKEDVDFILDEELVDMQQFFDDAYVLLNRRKELADNLLKRLLDNSMSQLDKSARDFKKFSDKVKDLKKDVADDSVEKVRLRERQHYADIEHDVSEYEDEIARLADAGFKNEEMHAWDVLASMTGFYISEVNVIRDSIARSSYGNVLNKELDLLFGVTKILEIRGSKHKSFAERFGIISRNRKHPWDGFPREQLLNTLDLITLNLYGNRLSVRNAPSEKKENNMCVIAFFSTICGGVKSLYNSVKELCNMVSDAFGNCIGDNSTISRNIKRLINISELSPLQMTSKQRVLKDKFDDMKINIKTRLMEIKSSLLSFDYASIK